MIWSYRSEEIKPRHIHLYVVGSALKVSRWMIEEAQKVLSFWIGELDSDGNVNDDARSRWFQKNPDFDQEIKQKFEPLVDRASQNQLREWQEESRSSAALVVLLDQFKRNLYRESAKAFESDPLALEVSVQSIQKGYDQELSIYERYFLYMPFMHSEDREVQKESLKLFESLVASSTNSQKKMFESVYEYAVRHKEIVDKFGRYPHRNSWIGRESTSEEIEFLKKKGSSF